MNCDNCAVLAGVVGGVLYVPTTSSIGSGSAGGGAAPGRRYALWYKNTTWSSAAAGLACSCSRCSGMLKCI